MSRIFHLDLRTPPSRATLHLDPDRDAVSFDRGGDAEPLDVTITLPGGVEFRSPAFAWEATLSTGGRLAVHRVEATPADAERTLLELSDRVGFDAAAIRGFVRRVTAAPNPIGLDNRVFTTRVGYLTFSADLRVRADAPHVLINYELGWDTSVTSQP